MIRAILGVWGAAGGAGPVPAATGDWPQGTLLTTWGAFCLRADVELTTTRSIIASPRRGSEASRRAARKSGSES
jgi:hypothetical protein